MISGSIRIVGFERLWKKLTRLPVAVQRRLVRRAMRSGAKVVQMRAKQTAPRDTGLLRRTITVRASKKRRSGKGGRQIAFLVQTREGMFKGETFYGAFLEFGHFLGKRGRPNRKWISPRPFMRQAFEQTKGQAVRTISDQLGREITAEAMKG